MAGIQNMSSIPSKTAVIGYTGIQKYTDVLYTCRGGQPHGIRGLLVTGRLVCEAYCNIEKYLPYGHTMEKPFFFQVIAPLINMLIWLTRSSNLLK